MAVLFVPGGLPQAFAPIPAALPYASSGGSVVTVGSLAMGMTLEGCQLDGLPSLGPERGPAFSAQGSKVVPNLIGRSLALTFNPSAEIGVRGRTRRYNVDPVPSTSGASVRAIHPGTPIAPSGPSVATQPWPRVQPIWPNRTTF